MSIKRLLNQVFFEVPDAVFDLTTGTVGIKKNGNIVTANITTNDEDGKSTIEVMHNVLSEFGMAVPAFGIKVPLNEVRVGDIVIFANKQVGGFAEKVNEKSLSIRKLDGTLTSDYTPPKVNVNLTGASNVTVVRSLLGDQNGGSFAGLQNSLLPLLMMSKKKGGDVESKLSKLVPLLMMSNGFGGEQSTEAANIFSNPTTLMLMMSKDGEFEDILPLLMMTGGLGGQGQQAQQGGMNPMMMMALMGDGDKSDMLPMLAMSGAFGGAQQGGMNPIMMMALMGDKSPFGDLFGGSASKKNPEVSQYFGKD